MNKNHLSFQVCTTQDELRSARDGVEAVVEGLGRNITKRTGDVDLGRTVNIFIRNKENKVVGGICGLTFGGWMYISLFWVEESLRNKGNGTKLLKIMEDEAVKIGCKYAHLDTYSFEARPFYEKHGYTVFATLENYPPGHCKYFLKKKLR